MTASNLRRLATFVWCALHPSEDQRGASLVEYALLVALIAVVCIIAITFLGQSASSKFSNIGSAVNN